MRSKSGFCLLLVLGAVLGAAGIGRLGRANDPIPAESGSPVASATQQPADTRQADRDAIRAALGSLAKAFENGDAAGATALMTSGAEIIPDEGTPIRGREAIKKAYADYFVKYPRCKIVTESHELRFTSRDTAIAEGRLSICRDGDAPESQRFSMLLVREDGKWLVALIKEWASEDDDLEDLGWLIGSWQASRTDVEVKTTYEWFGSKAFIRGTITAREKDITLSGMQLIGKDPLTGGLRIWSFGTDGGFAEGTCERDGNAWVFQSEGVNGEGEPTSAKNILLRVNNDTITWQPVNLTRGEEHVGDLPPVKVTRVKGAK